MCYDMLGMYTLMVMRLIFLVWSSYLGDIYDFLLIKRDHWAWFCVSEAVLSFAKGFGVVI